MYYRLIIFSLVIIVLTGCKKDRSIQQSVIEAELSFPDNIVGTYSGLLSGTIDFTMFTPCAVTMQYDSYTDSVHVVEISCPNASVYQLEIDGYLFDLIDSSEISYTFYYSHSPFSSSDERTLIYNKSTGEVSLSVDQYSYLSGPVTGGSPEAYTKSEIFEGLK